MKKKHVNTIILSKQRVIFLATTLLVLGTLFGLAPGANADTFSTTTRQTISGNPAAVAYDGTNYWAAVPGASGTLYKFANTTLAPLATVTLPVASVADLLWDGTNIWASYANDKRISKINPTNGSVIATYNVSFSGNDAQSLGRMAHDGAGNLFILDKGAGVVFKVRASDGSTLARWSVGSEPGAILYANNNLFINHRGTGTQFTVSLLSPVTGAASGSVTFPVSGVTPNSMIVYNNRVAVQGLNASSIYFLNTSNLGVEGTQAISGVTQTIKTDFGAMVTCSQSAFTPSITTYVPSLLGNQGNFLNSSSSCGVMLSQGRFLLKSDFDGGVHSMELYDLSVTISNVTIQSITQTSATIKFNSSFSIVTVGTFGVRYGTTSGNLNQLVTDTTNCSTASQYCVTLSGLTVGIPYYYSAAVWSALGEQVLSAERSFNTPSPLVETPKTQIWIDQNPQANVSNLSVTMDWHTLAVPGDSEVYYGTSAAVRIPFPAATTIVNDVACSPKTGTLLCWGVGNGGYIYRSSGSSWNPITSGTSAILRAVTVVNDTYLWAVGDNGTILHSTNGGSTWSAQTSPFGTAQHIYGVTATSSHDAWAVTHQGNVLKTTDEGATWTQTQQLHVGAINDIVFRRDVGGTVYGCAVGSNGGLWRSSGGNFTKVNLTSGNPSFRSCDVGLGTFNGYWAVGDNGAVYKATGLAAATATPLTNAAFTGESFYEVDAYRGDRVWFVGTNGKAFYTDDGGSNWQLINFSLPTKTFRGLSVIEPTAVQIVGDTGANYLYAVSYPSMASGTGLIDHGHLVGFDVTQENQTYHYKVRSTTGNGADWVGSWDYTFTSGFDDPTPPTWPAPNVQAAPVCSGSTIQVTLTWNPASDAESGINHYEIWRKVGTGAFAKIGTDIPGAGPYTYTDTPLATSTTYTYKIRAVNGAGGFTESPEIVHTTGTQTFNISWDNPNPPDVTVNKGVEGVWGIKVTRDWCFNQAITWSFVSAVSPSASATPITSSLVNLTGAEVLSIKPMRIQTGTLSFGTYSNITIRAVSGATTRTLGTATLTIQDTTAPTTPPVITGATVSCGANNSRSVQLTWNAAQDPESGIANYDIHRSTTSGFTPSAANKVGTVSGSTTSYTDNTVVADQTYFYKVVGISGAGTPVSSAEFSVSTFAADCDVDTTPPTGAPNLTNSLTCGTDPIQDVVLNWTQATDEESGIDRYEVFRGSTRIFTEQVNPPADTATHTYTDAAVGTGTYTYRIDAWNNGSPAAKVASNTINVTVAGSSLTLDVQTPATASVTVASGTPAQYTLKVTPQGCLNEDVTLSFVNYTGAPAPIDASKVTFAPVTFNPSTTSGQSTMTINTTGLPPGTYRPLRVNANSATSGVVNIDQSPQVTLIIDSSLCTDGTPNLTCKSTVTGNPADLPLYCDTTISFVPTDKCSICGCPAWSGNLSTDKPYCNTGNEKCELKCSDGTPNLSCSTISPGSYCDLSVSFDPIEDCTKCTSPTDGYCDAPNEVCNPVTKQCDVDDEPPSPTCAVTCTPGADNITVHWCTDEASTTGLKYGTISGSLPGWVGDTALVTDHTIATSNTLAPNTRYYYRAVSDDEFGNRWESPEQSCTTTVIVDTEPPSCSITAPADGATVSGTVPFKANATDNIGVTQVQFRAGAAIVGTDTGAPYEVALNTTAYPDGTLQLTITAVDAAGNPCNDEIFVTVANDNTGPQLVGDIDVEPFNGGQFVRVKWTTNEASQGHVAYGIEGTPQSGWAKVTYSSNTVHEVELGPLQIGQQYGAVIYACDQHSNCNYLNF